MKKILLQLYELVVGIGRKIIDFNRYILNYSNCREEEKNLAYEIRDLNLKLQRKDKEIEQIVLSGEENLKIKKELEQNVVSLKQTIADLKKENNLMASQLNDGIKCD